MGTYLARRLLLMVPTLLGISFLIFALVAIPGGGVSAVLQADGGGSGQGTSNNELIRAYLEDRYGLDEPLLVQYGRWLARISPVKFGSRDYVAPSGEIIRPPRPPKEPPLWRWFVAKLPDAPAASFATQSGPSGIAAYRAAAAAHAEARSRYVAATVALGSAAGTFAEANGRADLVDEWGQPRLEGFEQAIPRIPDRRPIGWELLRSKGEAAVHAFSEEQAARAELARVLATQPFPHAGVPIIPGVVSVGAPDFGIAYSTGRPVSGLIAAALPVTLLLNLIALPLIYIIAVPGGVLAAVKRGSRIDRGLGSLFLGLWSVPVVLAAVLAMGFLANPDYFAWFPASGLHGEGAGRMRFLPSWEPGGFHPGYLLDLVWHIALPVVCLVYGGFAFLSKQARSAVLENLGADHVRTARAKGVLERDVVVHHVVRNSLLPLITLIVGVFPAMLSGSVVIEKVFNIPGMGSLILQAINYRDRELLLATTMMIAAVNLLAMLLADVLYAWADPRVSYE